MLRSFLIYLSKAAWAENIVTNWSFAWKAVSRFIAGTTVAEALQVVRSLNEKGINATLDQLGEHTSTAEEAQRSADGIIAVLDAIQEAEVRSNVSIKLTQIGMGMDDEVCRANLERILKAAKKHKNFVRIDIEDSPYIDRTIAFYRDMLEKGFTTKTVGIAIQSYLYRAEEDVRELTEIGTTFRLIKGAYKEPPEVAYPKKADVDANFDTLSSILADASLAQQTKLSKDGRIPAIPAIATHDPKRVDFAKSYAQKIGLPKTGLEFQMLYGIRRDLQESLAAEGYPVRVYVPFGTHWYPYFMRRLAERPANLWFIVSNFFKK
ncbi:MAG: proline dehydrogenase family protein [Anaerolineales bacterium]|jgi:proline dehydrogenase|nr:proline dehydrogenase family protein [Anaerolineales bacterium]